MMKFRRTAFAALSAPLALTLAACGSGDSTSGGPVGDAIDPIAAPEGQNWNQTAVFTDMGGIQVGNPDAPLKLVEYASHTCSHCATFAKDSSGEIDRYIESGVVSLELRNQVHDPLDLTIAMLVRCGDPATSIPLAKQAWNDLEGIIVTAQQSGEALNAAMANQGDDRMQQIAAVSGLLDFFAARGISTDQALQCLADTEAPRQIVENSATQSDELDVTGTPTFFLNGQRLDGTSWAIVEAALQNAGAR
jgi:protein-disulfide isomerase